MDRFDLKPTFKTPRILFDPDNNIFEISGRSLPEDVAETYEPVLDWIDENFGKINDRIEIVFKMDYLNSASAKMIAIILNKIENFYKTGLNILIVWHYDEDDEDFFSEIENFSSFTKIPFKLIPLEKRR